LPREGTRPKDSLETRLEGGSDTGLSETLGGEIAGLPINLTSSRYEQKAQ